MRNVLAALAILCALIAPAAAQWPAIPATPEFPALTGRVVDDANVLDAATREALRQKLAAHEAKTGNQIVVATVKSLNGNSVEDYANRLFRRWQLGLRGTNNGVLLLHAPAERKIRIEVGYGLEGTLTDAIGKYIIQNAITPRFKANDFAGGLTRGVDDIIKVLDGGSEEFKQRVARRIPPAWLRFVEEGWPLLFFLAFGAREVTRNVGEVSAGSPAAKVLESGDRILTVDGRGGDQVALSRRISTHHCAGRPVPGCLARTPVLLRVERDGKVVALRVKPRYDPVRKRTLIGFRFGTRDINPGPVEAARLSGQLMWDVTSGTVSAIARIFEPQQRKQISGVVGSYEVTREAFTFDARRALTLLAVISLSLGVINLFPFLPLDGGHIFWSLVEKVRGRPVPFRVMEQAGVIGFMLVIFLAAIGLSNDIGRLTGEGFNTR